MGKGSTWWWWWVLSPDLEMCAKGEGTCWNGVQGRLGPGAMVLPLEALPRVRSSRLLAGEVGGPRLEVALKTGVWISQEQRAEEEETASHKGGLGGAAATEGLSTPLVPAPSPPTPTACLQFTPRVP